MTAEFLSHVKGVVLSRDRRRGGGTLGRRPQLSDEVAAYIRGLIMSGQIRQGEFLRLEHIAADLGISATPVREALLSLRGEGFVHLEPRRGFQVAPLSRQDVEDLFDVQAYVAGELTARAAVRMPAEGVAELERIQDEVAQAAAADDIDAVEEHNNRFHRTLNRAADSAKLAWVLTSLLRYNPHRFFGQIKGWAQAAIEDHRAILAALRAGDAEAARAAMRAHIIHAGALLIDHLEAQGFWEPPLPAPEAGHG